MVEVLTHGKMEENTKDNINSIKNTDLALILGRMEEDTWDNGKIVKGMEEER